MNTPVNSDFRASPDDRSNFAKAIEDFQNGRYINLEKEKGWFAAFGVQSPGAHEIQRLSPFIIIADSAEVKSDSEKSGKKLCVRTNQCKKLTC